MKGSDPGIVVTGYLKIAAEHRDASFKMLTPHLQRRRKKEGCITCAFPADILDPGLIGLREVWRDLKSLEVHLADAEFQGLHEEIVRFRIAERNLQCYEVSSTTKTWNGIARNGQGYRRLQSRLKPTIVSADLSEIHSRLNDDAFAR